MLFFLLVTFACSRRCLHSCHRSSYDRSLFSFVTLCLHILYPTTVSAFCPRTFSPMYLPASLYICPRNGIPFLLARSHLIWSIRIYILWPLPNITPHNSDENQDIVLLITVVRMLLSQVRRTSFASSTPYLVVYPRKLRWNVRQRPRCGG
jgi:hypothetical protein